MPENEIQELNKVFDGIISARHLALLSIGLSGDIKDEFSKIILTPISNGFKFLTSEDCEKFFIQHNLLDDEKKELL